MRRDWNTIREILLRVESLQTNKGKECVSLDGFEEKDRWKISQHAEILLEASLVVGFVDKVINNDPNYFCFTALTWEGHEFLDSIRNDAVWAAIEKKFSDADLAMTFDLIKKMAAEISAKMLLK